MSEIGPAKAIPRVHRRSAGAVVALCVALTTAIFVADTVFVISPALSVLYILPLLIIANSRAKRLVPAWVLVTVALAVVAFLIGLPLSLGPMALPNLAIGVATIAVTARQLVHSERLRRRLSIDERRYRGIFDSMAVAIWECDLRRSKRSCPIWRAAASAISGLTWQVIPASSARSGAK